MLIRHITDHGGVLGCHNDVFFAQSQHMVLQIHCCGISLQNAQPKDEFGCDLSDKHPDEQHAPAQVVRSTRAYFKAVRVFPDAICRKYRQLNFLSSSPVVMSGLAMVVDLLMSKATRWGLPPTQLSACRL
jgi:hypothetical protein